MPGSHMGMSGLIPLDAFDELMRIAKSENTKPNQATALAVKSKRMMALVRIKTKSQPKA